MHQLLRVQRFCLGEARHKHCGGDRRVSERVTLPRSCIRSVTTADIQNTCRACARTSLKHFPSWAVLPSWERKFIALPLWGIHSGSAELPPAPFWVVDPASLSESIWIGLQPLSPASCVAFAMIHPLRNVGLSYLSHPRTNNYLFVVFQNQNSSFGRRCLRNDPFESPNFTFSARSEKSKSKLQRCLLRMFPIAAASIIRDTSCNPTSTNIYGGLLLPFWLQSGLSKLWRFFWMPHLLSQPAPVSKHARYWAAAIPPCLKTHLTGWRWTSLSTIAQNICFIPLSAVMTLAGTARVLRCPG